jgi:hypothetical protein
MKVIQGFIIIIEIIQLYSNDLFLLICFLLLCIIINIIQIFINLVFI